MFYKNVFLENSAKFTGKRLCQSSFFNKAADWTPGTLLTLSWRRPLSYRNLNTFFVEYPRWLLLLLTSFENQVSKNHYAKFTQTILTNKAHLLRNVIKKKSGIYTLKNIIKMSKAVVQRYFVKKVFLEISQNSQENTCASVFRPQAYNFIKKETLAQVLSCEFCEISTYNFFTEHLSGRLLLVPTSSHTSAPSQSPIVTSNKPLCFLIQIWVLSNTNDFLAWSIRSVSHF